jgi:hypothetical protein
VPKEAGEVAVSAILGQSEADAAQHSRPQLRSTAGAETGVYELSKHAYTLQQL